MNVFFEIFHGNYDVSTEDTIRSKRHEIEEREYLPLNRTRAPHVRSVRISFLLITAVLLPGPESQICRNAAPLL